MVDLPVATPDLVGDDKEAAVGSNHHLVLVNDDLKSVQGEDDSRREGCQDDGLHKEPIHSLLETFLTNKACSEIAAIALVDCCESEDHDDGGDVGELSSSFSNINVDVVLGVHHGLVESVECLCVRVDLSEEVLFICWRVSDFNLLLDVVLWLLRLSDTCESHWAMCYRGFLDW